MMSDSHASEMKLEMLIVANHDAQLNLETKSHTQVQNLFYLYFFLVEREKKCQIKIYRKKTNQIK